MSGHQVPQRHLRSRAEHPSLSVALGLRAASGFGQAEWPRRRAAVAQCVVRAGMRRRQGPAAGAEDPCAIVARRPTADARADANPQAFAPAGTPSPWRTGRPTRVPVMPARFGPRPDRPFMAEFTPWLDLAPCAYCLLDGSGHAAHKGQSGIFPPLYSRTESDAVGELLREVVDEANVAESGTGIPAGRAVVDAEAPDGSPCDPYVDGYCCASVADGSDRAVGNGG